MKIHLKKNGRPMCGAKARKPQYVKPNSGEKPTCKRCMATIEE